MIALSKDQINVISITSVWFSGENSWIKQN